MAVLLPGVVVGYLPYRILHPVVVPAVADWSWRHYAASLGVLAGLLVLLSCIWRFAREGRGTLAPFDEPRRLVVRGLYRYVRNPMYVGVLLMLLGESWFFASRLLLQYTVAWLLIIQGVVLVVEEPRLRAKYGVDYLDYRSAVRRWLPGRPYSGRETAGGGRCAGGPEEDDS